jgi:hypothetical protein
VSARAHRVDDGADLEDAAGVLKAAAAALGRTAASRSRLHYDMIGAIYDWARHDCVGDGCSGFRVVRQSLVAPAQPLP